jgi:glycosyltransferase involved in cell wall biosynthesis
MRVCIPIEFQPQGGGFYFLQAFEQYLEKIGWEITRDLADRYDLIFTNHWMTPRREILRGLRHNPRARIVQRIDGAAQDYGRDPEADNRQARVNNLADLTVFQSSYCRYSTREKFPVIAQDGPVIHNPVDTDLFKPADAPIDNDKTRVISVTWSTNPLKGISKVYHVARNNPEIEFLLCGNFHNEFQLPNVKLMGVLGRKELAEALRSSSFMLTFSQNEACPNHVLEALSSGLPVLYDDSGAMQEVIGDCGLPVTVDSFAQQTKQIMDKLGDLSLGARQRTLRMFHPQVVLPKYIEAIEEQVARPLRKPIRRRWNAWASLLMRESN